MVHNAWGRLVCLGFTAKIRPIPGTAQVLEHVGVVGALRDLE
jgi:hypothetical protein